MKFAAFDLEIAKLIPENATNLKQYSPLGVSCAALAYSDREPVVFWQGVPQLEKTACQKIVGELREAVSNGYTLLTWNGCSFDFSVLAQESGMVEECSQLALQHVDLMLQVTFTKGHFLSLDKALTGAGVGGKVKTLRLSDGTVVTNMSGAMAPRLWANREYQAVLDYLRADVVQLLELAKVIAARKLIEWTSSSGRLQSVPVSRFLLAKECFGIPEPDVSWMDAPPSREQFVEWIPNWRQKVYETSAPTRSASSSVPAMWQNPEVTSVQSRATGDTMSSLTGERTIKRERNIYVAVSIALLALSLVAPGIVLQFLPPSTVSSINLSFSVTLLIGYLIALVFEYFTLRMAHTLCFKGWQMCVLAGLAAFDVLAIIPFVLLVWQASGHKQRRAYDPGELVVVKKVGGVVAGLFLVATAVVWWSIAIPIAGGWVRFVALPIILPTLPIVCLMLLKEVPGLVWWTWYPMLVGGVFWAFAEQKAN